MATVPELRPQFVTAHRFRGVENQTSAQTSSLVEDSLMAQIVNICQAEVQLRSLSPERASSPVRHLDPRVTSLKKPQCRELVLHCQLSPTNRMIITILDEGWPMFCTVYIYVYA